MNANGTHLQSERRSAFAPGSVAGAFDARSSIVDGRWTVVVRCSSLWTARPAVCASSAGWLASEWADCSPADCCPASWWPCCCFCSNPSYAAAL